MWVPVALLAAAVALIAWALWPQGSTTYHLRFQSAGQLVKGDLVRIGGTSVGKIEAIELAPDAQADVKIGVRDDYAPLHEGTQATVRAPGLTGVASRYVSLQPGSNTNPKLPGCRLT